MTNGFDKLMRESLSADAADHRAECLDAALVAGWFNGTLSHAERTASNRTRHPARALSDDRGVVRPIGHHRACVGVPRRFVAGAGGCHGAAALVVWIGVAVGAYRYSPAASTLAA